MTGLDLLLTLPTSALFVLLVALAIALVSMLVYRVMVDIQRLQSVSREIRRYNDTLKKAQKSGDRVALRRLKREERRLKQLSSYSQKQRLKVTLVTVLPFSAVSLFLGLLYGVVPVAKFPFETPFGTELSFYIWYTFCYFAVYFPLTRVFNVSLGGDLVRSVRGTGGR